MSYEDIKIINEPNIIDVLVNKQNKLTDNYIPNDLLPINSKFAIGMQYLRYEAKEYFEKMCSQAKID